MIQKVLALFYWQVMKWKCCQHFLLAKEKLFCSTAISTVKKRKMWVAKMYIGIMYGKKEVTPGSVHGQIFLKDMAQSFLHLMSLRPRQILKTLLFILLWILITKKIIQIQIMFRMIM